MFEFLNKKIDIIGFSGEKILFGNSDKRYEKGRIIKGILTEENRKAAIDFDKQYETSISKEWEFPNGLTADEVHKKYIYPYNLSFYITDTPEIDKQNILNDLIAYCRKLTDKQFSGITKYPMEVRIDILYGMVSGFNYDDIFHYSVEGKGGMHPSSKMSRNELLKMGLDEHYMQWVISPKTLEKIKSQFKVKRNFDGSNPDIRYGKGGGIPERYKNLGFTGIGQKKKSTRPEKKWMVLAKKGDQYKVVHGGYKGMEDYTQHHDKERRKKFWNRMGGFNSEKAKDPFSPLYWHKRFGTWEEGGIITPDEQLISVEPSVLSIMEELDKRGHQALIIGGAVRDALLGIEPKDIDVEVYKISYSDLSDFLAKFGKVDLVGKTFGVIKFHPRGGEMSYDFSVPRKENKIGIGHTSFAVTFDKNMTIADAGARRDFTFNAIAYDPIENKIYDYFGGLKDLGNKVIRHTSKAFSEDPLRILRAMQFQQDLISLFIRTR